MPAALEGIGGQGHARRQFACAVQRGPVRCDAGDPRPAHGLEQEVPVIGAPIDALHR